MIPLGGDYCVTVFNSHSIVFHQNRSRWFCTKGLELINFHFFLSFFICIWFSFIEWWFALYKRMWISEQRTMRQQNKRARIFSFFFDFLNFWRLSIFCSHFSTLIYDLTWFANLGRHLMTLRSKSLWVPLKFILQNF